MTHERHDLSSLDRKRKEKTTALLLIKGFYLIDGNAKTAKRTGEPNGSISIMVSVFVMCMIGPALTCLIFGFVIGWWISRRKGKTDIVREEKQQLRKAR